MSMTDRVREVALDLFAEQSYNATSMRDIARAAGFTPGAFYHHYSSKESILLDIMVTTMRRLTTSAIQAVDAAGDDPELRLRALVRAHVVDHGRYRNSAIVGDTELRAISAGSRATVGVIRDEYEELWRSAIEDFARSTGTNIDLALIRFAIIQMCSGVAQWYRSDGPISLDDIAEQFCEIAINIIVPSTKTGTCHA
ncbi:TetR/AcrR family transcriptional regulator [Nocardia asteroides]|uniref:TetR/AcrR family transcriptional regulator n=1 Tax=Nocardia asteroides TaxID=1824 RepID=UPI0037CAD780